MAWFPGGSALLTISDGLWPSALLFSYTKPSRTMRNSSLRNYLLRIHQSYARGWAMSVKLYDEQQREQKTTPKIKHKAVALSIVFLFPVSLLWAQALTQTIRGTVIDQESQIPLTGANVVVLHTEPVLGSSTDAEGRFRIENVPVGRRHVQITSIGYQEALISELEVGSGKEVVLTVRLTESLLSMEEIVITAEPEKGKPNNDMAFVSARSFTVEETKRYAASVNDPARMALSFAGVASTDDGTNEIVIRGNSPRGILWKVEGIEVPNPNHFGDEGASGGAVSMLSVNMLDNSDFYTGAFPAEYGNAASGVFDIRLRKGNNEKREYAFQAGFLGLDFAAEGPFRQDASASYLVNYRYSTLAILNEIGVSIDGDAVPDFQDLAFKVMIPSQKAGIFSVWGLGGLSRENVREDLGQEVFRYRMGVGGLSHTYFLSDKTYLESILSVSNSLNSFQDDEPEIRYGYHQKFDKTDLRGTVLLNHKFNAKHTLRTGLIISHLQFDLFSASTRLDTTTIEVDNEGSTQLLQSFVQWKYRLNEKVTFHTGAHHMYFALNQAQSLEPRLGVQWMITPTQSFNIGFGMHSRLDPLTTYFAKFRLNPEVAYSQPNKQLDLPKARHFVLGYDQLLRQDLHWKIEAYYQYLHDIPIGIQGGMPFPWYPTYSMLNYEEGVVNIPLVSEGTGRNYGVELTLEKFFTNQYYYMLTTSLYQSKYTPLDGKEYNTRFNGNYIVNLLLGKEFSMGKNKDNLLGINTRTLLAGGNRDTPLDLAASQREGWGIYRWDQRYSDRIGTYFRTDLRISYRRNKPRYSSILSLDIQNVTGRQNLYSRYFDSVTQKVENSYQLGLIPVLNYRLEF